MTLLILGLQQVTSRDFAIETITKVADLSFGSRKFPGEARLDDLRTALESDEMSSFQPIPSIDIFITREDIVGQAAPDIRSMFFQQFATRLYEQGTEGITDIIDETVVSGELVTQLRLLSVLSDPTHRKLRVPFLGTAFASLLLMIILIRLSSGLGRLTNPGLTLILVGLPGLVGLGLIKKLTEVSLLAETPKHDTDISGLIGVLTTNVASPMIDKAYPIYAAAFAAGLALLFTAGTAWLVTQISRRRRRG